MNLSKNSGKRKITEIDILRAVAIIAVVLIHGTSGGVGELQAHSVSHSVYLAVNKLSNFTVPVFVFISGLVLFYSYKDRWHKDQIYSFYTKRLRQILVPYLAASVFYYIYPQLYINSTTFTVNIPEFWKLLKWGETSYHLYFLIFIMQFYLLFPVLMSLVKRYTWFGKYIVLIGIAVHVGFYALNHWVYAFEHRSSLCFNYFSMFTLGAAVGLHYEAWLEGIRRYKWLILLGAVGFGGAFAGMYLLNDWYGSHFDNAWYEISVFAYSMFVGLGLIGAARKLATMLPSLYGVLASIGRASFGIYLLHPAFLTYWNDKVHLPYAKGVFHVHALGSIAWSFLGSWLLYAVYTMVKKGSFPGMGKRELEREAKGKSRGTFSG